MAILLVAGFAMALWAGSASAATIVVQNTGDAPAGGVDDVGCTIRDAVQAANTNAAVSNCNFDNAGADTIVLQSGKTYTLSQHAVDDTNAKGDLDITGQTTIKADGAGLATVDAHTTFSAGGPVTGHDRAIQVASSSGGVTLDHLRVTGGLVDAGNTFDGGGGILANAPLTIVDSEVVGNEVQGTMDPPGGGIYVRGAQGTLSITGSTISDNAVSGGNEPLGGGIAGYESSPSMTITNSTISGNTTSAGGVGAGIFGGDYLNHPAVTLTNVTVTDNHANGHDSQVGGIYLSSGSNVTGSLIAGNTADPGYIPDTFDCGGGQVYSSGGGNVIGVNGCNLNGPNDVSGTTAAPLLPNLGLLLDNGGPTRTHLPNPGSPAINRGGSCSPTDQRGLFRGGSAGACDAGAVEVGATVNPPPGAASASTLAQALAKAGVKGKVKVKGKSNAFTVVTGISASCPAGGAACSGSVTVKSAGRSRLARASRASRKLGKGTISIAAGQTQTVKVKLTKKASAALVNAGKLKAKISVKLATPGGTPAVASRTAKLKAPKKR